MHKKLVDVRKLVREKYRGPVPGFLLSYLENLVHQDELNELMQLQDYVDGVDLSNRLIERLGITVDLIGSGCLPAPQGRVLFASNHPLGGADGIVLTAVLGNCYRKRFHVMVTDLLMQVWQMRDVFVPINKYGSQSREKGMDLLSAMESDAQILTFPAGAVSRKGVGGLIRDGEWRPSFAKMAKRYERDIVPVYFEGQNSDRFYRVEQMRSKLGIKFNIGTLLLPSEFLGAKGKSFKIYIGERIPYDTIPVGPEIKNFSSHLHDLIYTFPDRFVADDTQRFIPQIP